ncbi:unnamed protein product [Porites evermanni]|uniref:Uncharacterized protein n=1 Tax=Porites evermanni TaxID=104178 RepID=A0ABN8SI41_9CNID|nr:unnamed protein product [Porites evermanni]
MSGSVIKTFADERLLTGKLGKVDKLAKVIYLRPKDSNDTNDMYSSLQLSKKLSSCSNGNDIPLPAETSVGHNSFSKLTVTINSNNCRLCGCSFKVKFGSQAHHFGVILAKLCESVGLPVKYCEDKSRSETFISCFRVKRDSSAAFQRRFPRPIEVH